MLVYEDICSRFFSVCKYAAQQQQQQQHQKPTMLLVDAEQSTLQAFIHLITVQAQKKYNLERPVIVNTYQAYLTSATFTAALICVAAVLADAAASSAFAAASLPSFVLADSAAVSVGPYLL